ncbi:3-dehydroquinate synthase II [Ruminiclostridium josui]|uniref:3-dehydroquinate synthase II n=1 Tax=Ruminiclostridium josui TaxID=1499 RepID=UPI0004B4ABEF|nr:3-dehydroquinate synthase II [Ruminiclostridium josui]
MMKNDMIWFDGRNLKNEEAILNMIYILNFENLLIKKCMLDTITPPHKMNLIVEINSEVDMEDLNKEHIVLSADRQLLQKSVEKGFKTALLHRIFDRNSMDEAWQIGSNFDYVVAEFSDTTNIPLELLVAKLQSKKTKVLKIVNSCQEMELAFGVMEVGSDGVVFSNEDRSEIIKVNSFIEKMGTSKIQLVKGKVTEVLHIGMGYRACIDTTGLLKENEGMLIGSTSEGGILVSSETHFLPYMELRPFRVNAGAVHSYVWAPDGETSYITELKGGSKLLCVDTSGNTREVVVGRVKIEKRPLLKIEVEVDEKRINAMVQDDWHIRIFGADGEVRNASTIKEGEELLTYVCQGGRHVGLKIDESIQEK